MDMTNLRREKTHKPICPNCHTDLTDSTRNWGSPDEGDYIVYQCQTCADYFGSDLDGMVYQPEWVTREVTVDTDDGVRVRITAFEPLTVELPAGRIAGKVTIELPAVHVQLYDLSLGGLLPGAHIGGDIGVVGLSFDAADVGMTPGQIADFITRAQPELKQIWRAYQDELDKRGALL